jgi:hypothetical protein
MQRYSGCGRAITTATSARRHFHNQRETASAGSSVSSQANGVARQNGEVRRVWESCSAGRPIRVPFSRFTLEPRIWLQELRLNTAGVTWKTVFDDPVVTFHSMLAWSHYVAHPVPHGIDVDISPPSTGRLRPVWWPRYARGLAPVGRTVPLHGDFASTTARHGFPVRHTAQPARGCCAQSCDRRVVRGRAAQYTVGSCNRPALCCNACIGQGIGAGRTDRI